jgi:hypothetical protein
LSEKWYNRGQMDKDLSAGAASAPIIDENPGGGGRFALQI